MKTQSIDIPKETIAHSCQHWHITEFALFGSVLRDDSHPERDNDVLVTFAPDAERDLSKTLQMNVAF